MNKKVDIYVLNKNIIPLIHYVQYSTEIPIEFQLMDYIIPQGATARYYIKKPSGLEVYNECQIQGNSVILQPTAQTFAESGRNQAQIQIVIAEKILVSFILKFEIEKNIITDSAIPSSNEFSVLDNLIQMAQQEMANISTAVSNATEAAYKANSAAESASAATESVNDAVEKATTAAGNANSAAQSADSAKDGAVMATVDANDAAEAANEAAAAANEAAASIPDIIPIEKGGTGVTTVYTNGLVTAKNSTTIRQQRAHKYFNGLLFVKVDVIPNAEIPVGGTMIIGTLSFKPTVACPLACYTGERVVMSALLNDDGDIYVRNIGTVAFPKSSAIAVSGIAIG